MVTVPNSALSHLRRETGHLHAEVEARLQIIQRLKSSSQRERLIAGYRTMLKTAAALLDPWLTQIEGLIPFPGLDQARSPAEKRPFEQCGNASIMVPILAYPPEALGFYYVMQGSALGGRLILRELESDGVDTTRLSFLNPYGDRTSQVWHRTTEILERHLAGEPAALALAAEGARKGYAFALHCLGSESEA